MSELVVTAAAFLFVFTVMIVGPAVIFFIFGGWPCLVLFLAYACVQYFIGTATEEKS